MKKIENYENVQASSGGFGRPSANGYCIEIIGVKDIPLDANTDKGDYLKIDYDIAHGDFKGYYTKQHERFGGDWFANFIRSYKETALGMFKHFTNCVEESNAGYKWDWNENGLVGKFVGVVLGEEEYRKSNGDIGVKLVVKDIKTVDQILTGDFKVPAIKKLKEETSSVFSPIQFDEISDDDLPFN